MKLLLLAAMILAVALIVPFVRAQSTPNGAVPLDGPQWLALDHRSQRLYLMGAMSTGYWVGFISPNSWLRTCFESGWLSGATYDDMRRRVESYITMNIQNPAPLPVSVFAAMQTACR